MCLERKGKVDSQKNTTYTFLSFIGLRTCHMYSSIVMAFKVIYSPIQKIYLSIFLSGR